MQTLTITISVQSEDGHRELILSDTCTALILENAAASKMLPENYVAACVWRTVPHKMSADEKDEKKQLQLFDLYHHYV